MTGPRVLSSLCSFRISSPQWEMLQRQSLPVHDSSGHTDGTVDGKSISVCFLVSGWRWIWTLDQKGIPTANYVTDNYHRYPITQASGLKGWMPALVKLEMTLCASYHAFENSCKNWYLVLGFSCTNMWHAIYLQQAKKSSHPKVGQRK